MVLNAENLGRPVSNSLPDTVKLPLMWVNLLNPVTFFSELLSDIVKLSLKESVFISFKQLKPSIVSRANISLKIRSLSILTNESNGEKSKLDSVVVKTSEP